MRILIFTGTRAEFGLLQPIARECEAAGNIDAQWLVTGMHLLPEYGSTVELVRADGLPVYAEVPYFLEGLSLPYQFGDGVGAFSDVLQRDPKPDWLLVLGDRHETLAVTLAASFCGIPVAHIHGGDRADSGHMDESQRHAITRFAALHLPASEASAERIRKFGEEEWRIKMAGAPGIDRLRMVSTQEATAIEEWRQSIPEPFLLAILHSVSTEADAAGEQARTLFSTLDGRAEHKLAVYPNNDPGGEAILAELKEREGQQDWTVMPNLDAVRYVGALKHAAAMVGNSSSGIIEAPFFGLPYIHTGHRNKDREHAGHVDFIEFDSAAINDALDEAVKDETHQRISALTNPYGDGHAAAKCLAAMRELHGHPDLLRKMITY